MEAEDEATAAFAYAWWLTGEEEAARAAVRAAAASHRVPGAGDDLRLPALLREIRAAAAPTPTMCPASEVALLHDVHGLPLDDAAAVACVDPTDARTELAHGRLEALAETVIEPCVHPERLGGLAVGNPADVAHARQCTSCGRARELLVRGRAELRDFGRVAVPADIAEVVTPHDVTEDAGQITGLGSPSPVGRPLVAALRQLSGGRQAPSFDIQILVGLLLFVGGLVAVVVAVVLMLGR